MVKLAGDPEHPITRGFLCYRTNQFLGRQYSPERLTTPLLRKHGVLTPVDWPEALDFVAACLERIKREFGPAAIFHYRSGGSLGILKLLSDYFFELYGPVTIKRGDICSGAGEAAQELDFGISDSSHPQTLLESRQILLWGKNVHTSSPHLIPLLKAAQARGAELVLIDPVSHAGRRLADRYYSVAPGGDLALALAIARLVFERGYADPSGPSYCDHWQEFRALAESRSVEEWCKEADVATSCASDLAERLGPGKPCAILVGWGMGRRSNGGAIVRALDALGAITGNLGIAGGGVSFYFQRRRAFQTSFLRGLEVAPRSIPEPCFGAQILAQRDPPLRALWVTAGNPVAMLPDSETNARAIASLELSVVVDVFLTDTARAANVVLPTTTLLEEDDVVGAYGHPYLGASRPVVPGPPEVRSDLQIIQGIAERVGLGRALAGSAREWKRRFVEGDAGSPPLTLEALEAAPQADPGAERVLFAGRRFPTRTGRVQLLTRLPAAATEPDPDFPLMLHALSTPRSQSSQWAHQPPSILEASVHPSAARAIVDGQRAWLESRLGSIEVIVRHDPQQRPDVVVVPKGGHLHLAACANRLIAAKLTDIGEGGALYEQRVRLVPLTTAIESL